MPQSLGNNLLARILQDARLKDFEKTSVAYFYDAEKEVYNFIRAHVDKYGALPTLDLTLRKTKLKQPDTTEGVGYWWDEYMNRALYNRFRDMLPQISTILKTKTPKDALDFTLSFIESLSSLRIDSEGDLATMASMGDKVLETLLASRWQGGITGVPTGWPSLDLQTRGWQAGDLYAILARPKMGKSMAMLHFASAAQRAGHTPLLISMEMKAEQMARRYYAYQAGLQMRALNAGDLSAFGEQRLREAINVAQTGTPFYVIEGQFKKDVRELGALIHNLRPSVVFIDAAYLMRMAQSGASKWEKITEIAEYTKTTATVTGVPIVASFQFNRQVKKKDTSAGFESIQLADAIGQLASAGVGIFEDPDGDSRSYARRRWIEIVGGREGEEGGFYINWDWERMNFQEIREEMENEEMEGGSNV